VERGVAGAAAMLQQLRAAEEQVQVRGARAQTHHPLRPAGISKLGAPRFTNTEARCAASAVRRRGQETA